MKKLFFLFILLPTFLQSYSLRNLFTRFTTSYKMYRTKKYAQWAQNKLGIPKNNPPQIEVDFTSDSGAIASMKIKTQCFLLKAQFLNETHGSQKSIMLHEAQHKKQIIEERLTPSTPQDKFPEFDREADEIMLKEIDCHHCLGEVFDSNKEAIKYQVLLIDDYYFSLSSSQLEDLVESCYQKLYQERGYLPYSAYRERIAELKSEGKECSYHRRQQIYKLMAPHMATYGLL